MTLLLLLTGCAAQRENLLRSPRLPQDTNKVSTVTVDWYAAGCQGMRGIRSAFDATPHQESQNPEEVVKSAGAFYREVTTAYAEASTLLQPFRQFTETRSQAETLITAVRSQRDTYESMASIATNSRSTAESRVADIRVRTAALATGNEKFTETWESAFYQVSINNAATAEAVNDTPACRGLLRAEAPKEKPQRVAPGLR